MHKTERSGNWGQYLPVKLQWTDWRWQMWEDRIKLYHTEDSLKKFTFPVVSKMNHIHCEGRYTVLWAKWITAKWITPIVKVDILCLVWPTRKHCFGESGIQLINLAGTWKNTWVNSECALKLLSRQFSLKWNSFAFELCLVAPRTTQHCTTYSATGLQFRY